MFGLDIIKEHTRKGNDPEYIPNKKFGFIILDILKKLIKPKTTR